MNLPVLQTGGDLAVVDPDTGEAVTITEASDHALAHAAAQVADLDRDLLQVRRALAAELRDRHGVGKTDTGGFAFTVSESQSWPVGATTVALDDLLDRGAITRADYDRAMPSKPRPDSRALKSLIGRLTVSDPDAARHLAAACTVSPPAVRDLQPTSLPEAT